VAPTEELSDGMASPEHRAPELADLRRYGRRAVNRFVQRAREDERPRFDRLIADHLGVEVRSLPVAEERWPAYELPNVQAALDAWLAEDGRPHTVVGITGQQFHPPATLTDLMAPPVHNDYGPRPGNVSRTNVPVGPDGETMACLSAALLLVTDGDDRLALLVRSADPQQDRAHITVQVVSSRADLSVEVARRLRELVVRNNVFRGQVVSFGGDMFGQHGTLLKFHRRLRLPADALVLPRETFADVRRQVVGVARARERLRASGQHLKRGLLLYGPPGVGKTHTVRYLIGELTGTTIVQLTGKTLHAIGEACSIARTLQPSMIVVEDVDLIAEQRDHFAGGAPLLFTLLNEMDGLDDDADVVFLLTTNRADLLEEALASRPGRVDQAVHIGLPDRDARLRLVELYRRDLGLDDSRLDSVLDRTDGVTASFLKELLRRAAVVAADREGADASADALRVSVEVSADDLDAALEELLDTRNRMTRRALGLEDTAENL
jgi:ATPase family associated with various cellular activities (AAA)